MMAYKTHTHTRTHTYTHTHTPNPPFSFYKHHITAICSLHSRPCTSLNKARPFKNEKTYVVLNNYYGQQRLVAWLEHESRFLFALHYRIRAYQKALLHEHEHLQPAALLLSRVPRFQSPSKPGDLEHAFPYEHRSIWF